jgi:hypothetical protein
MEIRVRLVKPEELKFGEVVLMGVMPNNRSNPKAYLQVPLRLEVRPNEGQPWTEIQVVQPE